MFPRPNFQVSLRFIVIGRIASSTHILQTTPDSKSKGKQSLNRKTLASFLSLLKIIWSLEQSKMFLEDFLNSVLVYKETSPRYGSDRTKVFFSTVIT